MHNYANYTCHRVAVCVLVILPLNEYTRSYSKTYDMSKQNTWPNFSTFYKKAMPNFYCLTV